jgi:hypothetical protein
MILHPAFEKARDGLLRALRTDMPGQLIFVIGMSGAGKSEVRYASMPVFAGSPNTWGKGQIPAIAVRATPSDRSYYSDKEFSSRLYFELLEPDVSWLAERASVEDADRGHARAEARLTDPFWRNLRNNSTAHQLRASFERMAVARGLRAVFVEEAGSMTYTQSGKHPGDHMVSYMCLAEEIRATLVLFGVPRMAALWEGNAEIRRRSRFVFVDRYRLTERADRTAFARLAVSLAAGYRFSRADLLSRNLDLAYAASAGVCGELKGYLLRADDLRAGEGEPSILKRHLEEAIYSQGELETLHRDAAAFDAIKAPAAAASIRAVLCHGS